MFGIISFSENCILLELAYLIFKKCIPKLKAKRVNLNYIRRNENSFVLYEIMTRILLVNFCLIFISIVQTETSFTFNFESIHILNFSGRLKNLIEYISCCKKEPIELFKILVLSY